ncbi:MAG TPA: FtsX-like permease family protein [Burkholderiaceae bacterium]|nr:FtsX-like permease family protein [Burkholderiaceae bacterium]
MGAVRLSWILAQRDWRAGELRLLLAALIVAVAAIASVGFFVERLNAALSAQARQLMGADLRIASDRPFDTQWVVQAKALGLQTAQTVSFPSMAVAPPAAAGALPAMQLTSLKAVSDGYPLRGTVRIADRAAAPDRAATGVPERGTLWADPQLLQALGIGPGATIQLGDLQFVARHLITIEPDRGANFVNFAPRAMIALDDLQATGLVQPASRVTYRLLVAGDPAALQRFEHWAEARLERGQRLETLENARPELRMTLERSQQFLALVALLAALIAAVAIAVAARRFSDRHLDSAAVMRAIGVTQGRLTSMLLLEMLWLGLAGGLAGAAIGWLAHHALVAFAAPMIRLTLPPASLLAGLQAVAAGLLLVLGFAAVPLTRLAGVPPLRVLRRELGAPPMSAWVTGAAALAAFGLLLLWQAGDRRLAAVALAGFAGGAVAFVAVAWAGIRLVAPLRHVAGGRNGRVALRLALASWTRRRASSIAQTAALAVGLTALMLLTVTRGDLLDSWQRATPPDAPNRFVINVQPDQVASVKQMLRDAQISEPAFYPVIRGRLIAINDRAIGPETFDSDRARRLVDREFNLSYLREPPAHNRVSRGRWINPDRLEVSIEEGLMQTLGLNLGDRLTFDIAGDTTVVTAVGVRTLAWDSMQVNFFMILSPQALADRPQTMVTAFHLPAGRDSLANELVSSFPNVTVVDTTSILRQVQAMLEHVVRAVQFLFLFTLAAGIVVLYAALASSRDERIREAGLMRALGASRGQLVRAQAIELAASGALAGLLAALAAITLGAVLAHTVFQFDYTPRWSSVPLAAFAGAALSLLAGWFSLRTVTRTPPLLTLRDA